MTREAAARVAALLQARYLHGDIHVTRIPDGLRVEVHADGSSLFAVVRDEHSAVLASLGAIPWPPPLTRSSE